MRILFNNLLDSTANTLSASSEASGYDVESLQDTRLSKKWRTTGKTAEWVMTYNAGGIAVTCTAIAGHNLSSGGTFKVQGNDTDVWTTPSVDETITHAVGIMVKFFTGGTYNYWRVSLADASNPSSYVESGRVFFGQYLDFGEYLPDGAFPYNIEATGTYQQTQTGELYTDDGVILRSFDIIIPYLSNTVRTSLETMIGTIQKRPIIVVPNENDLTTFVPLYCFIEEINFNSKLGGYIWDCVINMKETK